MTEIRVGLSVPTRWLAMICNFRFRRADPLSDLHAHDIHTCRTLILMK